MDHLAGVQAGAFGAWIPVTNNGNTLTGWVGTPQAVLAPNGLISVFTRATNGTIGSVYQTVPGGSINNYAPVGSGTGFVAAGDPTAVVASSGTVQIFTTGTDGQLWTAWQWVQAGAFSAWTPVTNNGNTLTGWIGTPQAVLAPNGLISVFTRATNGTIGTVYQTVPGGSINNYSPMPSASGLTAAGDPTVVVTSSGAMSAFLAGTDGNQWIASQSGLGASWAGWQPVYGVPSVPVVSALPALATGTVNLTASVTTGNATKVAYYVDGLAVGESTNAPSFPLAWNTAGFSPSGHAVTAYSSNAYGTSSASTAVTTTVIEPGHGPTVVNGSGLLSTFTIQNGTLNIAWQAQAGGAIGPWTPVTNNGNTLTGWVGAPQAVLDGDGSVNVFARADNGTIGTVYQTAPNGSINNYKPVTPTTPFTPVSDLSAVRSASGTLALFDTGSDGQLWTAYQNSVGGAFTTWAPVTNNGSPLTGWTGAPQAVLGSNGAISVFARATNGTIGTVFQTAAGGSINNYVPVTPATPFTPAGDPSAALAVNGAFSLFDIGTDGQLWTTWQSAANGAFGEWTPVTNNGNTLTGWTGTPQAVLGPDGSVSAFARATNGTIGTVFQTAPGSSINNYVPVGATTPFTPRAIQQSWSRRTARCRGSSWTAAAPSGRPGRPARVPPG
ncbi:hypothetical protein ACFQ9X_35600 [Catenulispora yoronensis]